MILNIFLGLLGLGLLITIHEFGHLLAAVRGGVCVEAFSVGWGPVIWKKTIRQIEFRLSAIPLGGYCKMKGSESLQEAILNKSSSIPKENGSFYSANWLTRCIILLAGPGMNLLTALLLFWAVFFIGIQYETFPNKIALSPDSDSPAAAAGLQTGDIITRINNKAVTDFQDLRQQIAGLATSEVTIYFERDGLSKSTQIIPKLDKSTGAGIIGVYPYIEPVINDELADMDNASYWQQSGIMAGDRLQAINGTKIQHAVEFEQIWQGLKEEDFPVEMTIMRNQSEIRLSLSAPPENGQQDLLSWQTIEGRSPDRGFIESGLQAGAEIYRTISMSIKGFIMLFRGADISRAVSGPLEITYMVGAAATNGFSRGIVSGITAIFHFLGLISVVLAFMNLLPIPALDGGQILFTMVERISPFPYSPVTIVRYQNIGAAVILVLLVFAVTSDLFFLFRG